MMSSGGENSTQVEAAELFVETLRNLGVDYVFMNAGSDTLPIMESLAKLRSRGVDKPSDILCPHEGIAVSMAEGYAMVSGKPQLVAVHVDVGTQNCGSALHNVLRDRVPLVLFAGITPSSLDGKVRGSRDIPVHWLQDPPDQSLILRDYVKWCYQVRFPDQLPHVLIRAFQTANATPEGPSYLMVPRETLMEKVEAKELPLPSKYSVPSLPQPDLESLRKAADMLLEAEAPVILTNYLGRRTSAVKALIDLSEMLAIPVLEPKRDRTNFPSTHPNYQGRHINRYVNEADAILILDVDVPWLFYGARRNLVAKPRQDARIIHIDIDPLKEHIPLWGFPVDLSMAGDSSITLPALNTLLAESPRLSSRKEWVADRAAKLKHEHETLKKNLVQEAQAKKSSKPINPAWLFYVLNMTKSEDDLVIDDSVTNNALVQDYVDTTIPGTFFGVTGSSMGWGLPAALGVKLARMNKTVIGLTGDGSFIFANPVAGLYVAKRYSIPILQIVLNNRGYAAVKKNFQATYTEGWSKNIGKIVGVDFEESPDYAAISRACSCSGVTLDDPAKIEETLEEALVVVGKGQSVVVDVKLEPL